MNTKTTDKPETKPDQTALEKTRENKQEEKKSAAATLATLLEDPINKRKIADSCARGLDSDRLVRIALTAMQKNSLLLECSGGSVIRSLMDCASYGLVPNSQTNEAHLVPFKNNKTGGWDCVLIVGYKGLVKMATNTGLVSHVTVRECYKNDFLEYEYGLDERLIHRPAKGEPGEFIGAYSIVRFKDGGREFRVVLLEEGRAHRDRFAPSWKKNKTGPWITDEPAMIMKTSLRKVCKYVPASPESETLAIAIARDERLETSGYQGLLDMDNLEPEEREEIPEPQPLKQEQSGEENSESSGEFDSETGEEFPSSLFKDSESETKE